MLLGFCQNRFLGVKGFTGLESLGVFEGFGLQARLWSV